VNADLPFIDAHSRLIVADAEEVWAALGRTLARTDHLTTTLAVRLLGARPATSSGDPLERGASIPGFAVVHSVRPTELALAGRHRFSRYELTFRLEADHGTTLVRAESRARFPGRPGRLYELLVIGSRGHIVAVRRLLAAIAREAALRS
jgi:hypothetical protein